MNCKRNVLDFCYGFPGLKTFRDLREIGPWFDCEVFVSQFEFPGSRHVFFMVIYDVIAWSEISKWSLFKTILRDNRKILTWIRIRRPGVYQMFSFLRGYLLEMGRLLERGVYHKIPVLGCLRTQ